jgi:hypothetical protein
MMSDICYSDDERPGPTHSFKFRYSDDICSFLVVAHGLNDAQIFTNRIVRLEEIFPSDVQTPCKYLIGRKMPLEEGGGFLVSFDLTQIVSSVLRFLSLSTSNLNSFFRLFFVANCQPSSGESF